MLLAAALNYVINVVQATRLQYHTSWLLPAGESRCGSLPEVKVASLTAWMRREEERITP